MNNEINIGLKIKSIRLEKKLLLKEVASKCGISSSLLSQIEKGGANPSLNTIKAISNALEVPIFKFFIDEETTIPNIEILRKNERKTIITKDVIYELFSPNKATALECMKMIFSKKGAQTSINPMAHKGEEVAIIVKGSVQLFIYEHSIIMNEEDSVLIPPNTPHKWINVNDGESIVIFSVTPPEF